MATRWTSETTIKFIQEYRHHECLWNMKSPTYKNKHMKTAAYESIVEAMQIQDFNVPEVKTKIRNLRSTYCQEKKKIENSKRSGSGTDTVYVPNIKWFKEMDFFIKDEKRQTIDNAEDDFTQTFEGTPNSMTSTQASTESQATASTINQTGSSTLVGPSTKVRYSSKRNDMINAIKELRCLREAINNDGTTVPAPPISEHPFDIFAKSVAAQMKTLSFERAQAQSKIQNILTDIAIEDFRFKNMYGASDSMDEEILQEVIVNGNDRNNESRCTSPAPDFVVEEIVQEEQGQSDDLLARAINSIQDLTKYT